MDLSRRDEASGKFVAVRALGLLSVYLVTSVAVAQDLGPVKTRNHRALSLPFLRLDPSFGVLGRGEREFSFGFSIANDMRRVPAAGPVLLEEDHETTRLNFGFRQGLGDGNEWWLEVPFLSRGGGFLDPIIDGWHQNVLGWTDPVRDSTAFGRSVISLPNGASYGSASGIGDTTVGYRRRIRDGIEAAVAIKLPTGDAGDLLGSGGVDLAASLFGRLQFAPKWYLFGQLGFVLQGNAKELPDERRFVDQESFAIVYAPNSKDSWIAQWQSEASALKLGMGASDAPHRQVTFGYRRRLSSIQTLEAFFTEDRDLVNGRFPEIANTAPDFTAGLRWMMRF